VKLNAFTDYSLRVLIYVGLRRGERVSVAEVAAAYGISRNHVVKVVRRLQELGALATFRGRSGGIELGMAPDRIAVGQLVAELESMDLVECFLPQGDCALDGCCALRRALEEARRAFLAALDRYTLADLLRPKAKLRAALALGEARVTKTL